LGLRKTSRCTTALAALQRQGRRRALDGPQMAAGSPPVGEGRFPEPIGPPGEHRAVRGPGADTAASLSAGRLESDHPATDVKE
jgi:hypothetical protein